VQRLLARAGLGGPTRPRDIVLFALLPLVFATAVLAISAHGSSAYGVEFKGNLWEPAKRILAGESPYQPARLDDLLHGRGPDVGRGYIAQAVYPAPAHVAAVPFGLLPLGVAVPLFIVLSTLGLVIALWLLEVRDWRCYGLVFLAIPTVHALNLGGLTPLLLLGVAVLWRYRDRPWVTATAAAALVAAKLYLWPLVVWLALRFRGALLASALTAVFMIVGWAVIGFAGFTGYPHLLRTLAHIHQLDTYALPTIGFKLGLSLHHAREAAVIVGLALLAAALLFARRRNEQGSFALALAASLALTPIVWQQYFLLLFVPIAFVSPRLGLPWILGLTFWLASSEGGTTRDLIVAWATTAAAVGLAVARSPGARAARIPPSSESASHARQRFASGAPARR
jgi:hypothetical protein